MFSVPIDQMEFNVVLELYNLAFTPGAGPDLSLEDMVEALNQADLTKLLAGRFPV